MALSVFSDFDDCFVDDVNGEHHERTSLASYSSSTTTDSEKVRNVMISVIIYQTAMSQNLGRSQEPNCKNSTSLFQL